MTSKDWERILSVVDRCVDKTTGVFDGARMVKLLKREVQAEKNREISQAVEEEGK